MADYYPLIAKAVAGLDKSTGEARRALYDRARNALVTQLRSVSPALSEQDITRERLALEEAIRKVEAEAARKSRFDPPPERKRIELDEQFRPTAPQPMRPVAPPEPPPEPDDAHDAHDAHPEPNLSGTAADLRRPQRMPPADRGPPASDGLKGFRHVVADAENLGDATAQASRSAREAYNAMPSPSPEFDRLEPRMEPEGLRARRIVREQPPAREPMREPVREPAPMRGPASMREPARPPAVTRQPPPREAPPPPGRDYLARGPTVGPPRDQAPPPRERPVGRDAPARREPPRGEPSRNEFSARDFGHPDDFDAQPVAPGEPDEDFDAPSRLRMMRRRVEEPEVDEELVPPPMRIRERLFAYLMIVIALVVVAGVVGVVVWQWQPMVGFVRGLVSRPQTAQPVPPVPTPNRPKITDRIGSNDQVTPGQQAAADVAQRVVLYEEDPEVQTGKRFVGTAVWRTEQVSPGAGQPPETVVRADISIPDRKITMKWSLRRNTDKTLPASHTVEIVFTLPPDFPHQGGIANVPGVLMKESEEQRGVPLAGSAVKVTDGYFLIGLSAVDTEMQRNIQLLKERPWFDVPIVYGDTRRAILAVEKGTPGERAFNEAFAAWRQ